MSQEQPPIRSRRELRQARDAQQASVAAGADQLPAAVNRPAPNVADRAPEQTHTQRSSQIRARDRAALRTIKELEEKEGQLSSGGAPTRRQLRLQQLKEQTLTAATPVVRPAEAPAKAATADPKVQPSQTAAPVRTPPAPTPTRSTRPGPTPSGPAPAGPTSPAAAPLDAAQPAATPSRAVPSPPVGAPEGMTVEQALAARALIAEQAKNQIAKMEHIASLDPEAVDPAILAEQIALAERAAIMNRRAMAKQKLAEQAAAPAATPKDTAKEPNTARPGPSTASNLAMVTPLEFVQVPGVDRPVMKPPATSHVPVTTRPGKTVPPGGGQKRRPASRPKAGSADAGRIDAGSIDARSTEAGGPLSDAADTGAGRSQVIARAEAAARAARRQPARVQQNQGGDLFEDLPRIPARSAHGLDPLDAATAGLARARRTRILQLCILLFGIVALVSGIILIISGISR